LKHGRVIKKEKNNMADLNKLFQYIENGDVENIKKIMEEENLKIENGKLVPVDINDAEDKVDYFDQSQMTAKLNLNSLYGAVTNVGSMFFEQRMGASTTLTGRCTTRHMGSKINEAILGKYEIGDAIIYGDSVAGDSIVRTSSGPMTISDLYDKIEKTAYMENGKEYAIPTNENIQIVGYDIVNDKAIMTDFNFVMRHKTNKNKWEVITEDGKSVIVTDDHSIMVERNGNLIEVKPNDLVIGDFVIVVNDTKISRNLIKSFTHIGTFENEYVYDLSVKENDTVFFANDVLVKNTDSVANDSIIETNNGKMTIERLFHCGEHFWNNGEKEYSLSDIQVVHYNDMTKQAELKNYNYVYRHKVSKPRYEIETENGKVVQVTGDHSIMVLEDDILVEKKPYELTEGDKVITMGSFGKMSKMVETKITIVKSVKQLADFDNEYVYDIGIDGDPYFFANGILVHNSSYFTVPNPDDYTKEQFIEYSDKVAKVANDSFPEFFNKTFNVSHEFSKPIKCAREICATAGLFIKKKRYSAMVYDEKGFRKDENGKMGKLKVMGLDIKRADCPVWVQDKLEETIKILLGENKTIDEILEFIRDWRQEFSEFDSWKMGIPKRVNKLTHYNQVFVNKTSGVTIPGHVRASINWNTMLNYTHDLNSPKIGDGGKVIVCKLKKNKYNMDSIAYPYDQSFLPDWFKNLPFDDETMIEVAVDQKVKNIFGILGWDLEITKRSKQFSTLFTME
jgi:hypothetical protein